jgi:hypothetical protein
MDSQFGFIPAIMHTYILFMFTCIFPIPTIFFPYDVSLIVSAQTFFLLFWRSIRPDRASAFNTAKLRNTLFRTSFNDLFLLHITHSKVYFTFLPW